MPGTSPGMTSVALLLRRLSSFLPPLSHLLPRHSALLTPLVLGRLVQGIKPTQQVLTQPLGLGSLIPVFRLGAVERLAPGATGFHFLHGVEAVFQGQPPMRSAQRSTSPRQARARKQALSPQMRPRADAVCAEAQRKFARCVAVCHSLLQTKLVIVGLDPTIQ